MKHFRAIALLSMSLMASCSGFVGAYSARSHEHLTNLKAHHIKLIEDNTQSSVPLNDRTARLSDAIDTGDLKFREAEEFARSLGSPQRTSNIQLLRQLYREDSNLIVRKGRPLTAAEAETMKSPTQMAYDSAIKGEQVRISE